MKIAVLAHTHHPIAEPYAGGLEAHTHLLCKSLVASGHEVTLYAKAGSAQHGYQVEAIVSRDFAFHPLPAYSYEWSGQEAVIKRIYSQALDAIEASDCDVIINNSLNATPWERTYEIPMLTVLHTPILPLLEAAATRASIDPSKVFATISEANARAWARVLPGIVVVENGIDGSSWNSAVQTGSGLRWSGRLTAVKGVEDAIATARLMGEELMIAGPISDPEYFESEVEPHLSSTIRYVGHLDHKSLVGFYASGRVTLMTPKWEEPFGLVAAESLMSGTPVAAYARGGLSKIVNGRVGAVASVDTPEQLAVAVRAASRIDPQVCRSYARRNFGGERMTQQYLALLASVSSVDPLFECRAG